MLAAATRLRLLSPRGARLLSALSADEFRAFTVTDTAAASHDSQLLTLALPEGETPGLRVCGLVMARPAGGEEARPYTPVSREAEHAQGRLQLLVKGYPGGAVSEPLCRLGVGDAVELQGPFDKFQYERNSLAHVGMVAGGSGLTPMLQLARHVLADPADRTRVSLTFANKTEADILLRAELDAMAAADERFSVSYVLEDAPAGWEGDTGRPGRELLERTLAGCDFVAVCGPPPMVEALAGPKGENFTQGEVSGVLAEMGYGSSGVYKF